MTNPLHHKLQFSEDYSIEFKGNKKNEKTEVIGTVYSTDQKIEDFVVNVPFTAWTIHNLPESIHKRVKSIIQRSKIVSDDEYETDDDYETTALNSIFVYAKDTLVPVHSMTIRCHDKNIKGSTLIRLVHEQTQQWYGAAVEYAGDPEVAISPPLIEKGILHINAPRDWFISLGGWKGMMPQKEVQDYFFIPPQKGTKFSGVRIFDKETLFPILEGRIHITEHFKIGQVDITELRKKLGSQFAETPRYKTDLSYPQIIEAIDTIKTSFAFDDSKIAEIQLSALSHEREFPPEFKEDIHHEVLTFLNYLNGLMFGVEASGLNAALIIGLMTLELIVQGSLTYQQAFKANDDGGVYPYACFGNNKGTYSQREKVLNEDLSDGPSMKPYRNGNKFSPVANKEAILIKEWLVRSKLIKKKNSHDEQVADIKECISDLIKKYFAP